MSKNSGKIQAKKDDAVQKIKSLGVGKIILLTLGIAVTVLAFVFYEYIFGAKTVFVEDKWRLSFANALWMLIPKLVKSVQVVTIVSLIASIILVIIAHIGNKTQRGITVGRLIYNIIKVIVIVALTVWVLAIWGVNTTALITGAGVITLVVGLGMQSLISDVVAGLFIVFENEFNVGDYITIDDFRGEVISIGIRTTKLRAVGNIKIYNNSDIRKVLNHALEHSTAKTLIDIEYGAQLPKVEEIIKAKLPEIQVEGAKSPVSYDGVAVLGASGVTLQFTCLCNEGDIFAVTRDMNKKIKIMFDDNGIGIPFPQVVVHTESSDK